MSYLYNVSTKKDVLLTVRVSDEVRDKFKTACELRGGSMSSLMHQFIVKTIREEKEREPQAFQPKGIKAATIHLQPIKKRKTG